MSCGHLDWSGWRTALNHNGACRFFGNQGVDEKEKPDQKHRDADERTEETSCKEKTQKAEKHGADENSRPHGYSLYVSVISKLPNQI